MAKARKRRVAEVDDGDLPSSGFEVLDRLIEHGTRRVVAVVVGAVDQHLRGAGMMGETVPTLACGICQISTDHICFACRRPFCRPHLDFYRDDGLGVCGQCMRFMVSSAQRVLRGAAVAAQKRVAAAATPPIAAPRRTANGKPPWEILGVDAKAEPEEIKRAFRRRALETHPDRNPTDPQAGAKFKEINDAYQAMIEAAGA